MLGLKLRQEFRDRRLKGTSIELAEAVSRPAKEFLEITYPSVDLLATLEAVRPSEGRTTVLIGERGQGKSHIMAALTHALVDPEIARDWLHTWGDHLGNPRIAAISLREGMRVIAESLHRQRYKFLWDLIFDQHPHGDWARGKWEGLGASKTEVPPDNIFIELFKKQPTALVLDEYQTWFEGLTNTKQYPWRTWAFNFIQILSEIAKDHPDLLVLVVSVRDGTTDAYQQVQRVNPRKVDFQGPTAKRDRLKLLLHRLFENRRNVQEEAIRQIIKNHVQESLRLLDIGSSEHETKWREFVEAWPFSPNLISLLEDQILVATQAQETRDLIRILVDLFKRSGENSPVITAADFRLDEEASETEALLSSVANQHHRNLREIAQRNLESVLQAVKDPEKNVPNLAAIVGSLWARSLATENHAGAEPEMLQCDITRDKPIDDNAFAFELDQIVESSFNIHRQGSRLIFREEENPQAKLMANAKNDKLFAESGADKTRLANETRYVLLGQDGGNPNHHVIVLREKWDTDPWTDLEDADQPSNWDERHLLIVLPVAPEKIARALGSWLKQHLQAKRNMARFLLPQEGLPSVFADRSLLILARAVELASQWKATNSVYSTYATKYQKELRGILKSRFDRFAILDTWDYGEPSQCAFHIERHDKEGSQIPDRVDEFIRGQLFIPETFEQLVLQFAEKSESVGKLLAELQEPRPNKEDCIPWLGEVELKERLIRLCSQGRIAISVRDSEILQLHPGEDPQLAFIRMRGRLGKGRELFQTVILLPQAVPHAAGVSTAPPLSLFGQAGAPPPAAGPVRAGEPAGVVSGASAAIFTQEDKPMREFTAPATSSLNLLGRVEQWGINAGSRVLDANLRINQLTGAQLNDLLKKLPDGLTYELSLKKEET